ncbi:UrcA family protein [Altererythrobacter sp. B11]|uniref:UrcA family protein n=1 Tax=Altererythrobacter sp. B11 TaxID=2060312 RepID=UPI001E35CB55|nr:UrcA family protein [Altererythrobacter sp. B11]
MKTTPIMALAAASLSILAIAPAQAEDGAYTVSYGDLDLSSPAGAHTLALRVDAGVDRVCERPFIRDLKGMVNWQECRETARTSAIEQLQSQGVQQGTVRFES